MVILEALLELLMTLEIQSKRQREIQPRLSLSLSLKISNGMAEERPTECLQTSSGIKLARKTKMNSIQKKIIMAIRREVKRADAMVKSTITNMESMVSMASMEIMMNTRARWASAQS
jgi:hypothetical protein